MDSETQSVIGRLNLFRLVSHVGGVMGPIYGVCVIQGTEYDALIMPCKN